MSVNLLSVFQINYSTAEFEKTISVDNDPRYFDPNFTNVSMPQGSYRIIADKVVRILEGLPNSEQVNFIPPQQND